METGAETWLGERRRGRQRDVYGPNVELPEGAGEHDRVLAFTGRDPRM